MSSNSTITTDTSNNSLTSNNTIFYQQYFTNLAENAVNAALVEASASDKFLKQIPSMLNSSLNDALNDFAQSLANGVEQYFNFTAFTQGAEQSYNAQMQDIADETQTLLDNLATEYRIDLEQIENFTSMMIANAEHKNQRKIQQINALKEQKIDQLNIRYGAQSESIDNLQNQSMELWANYVATLTSQVSEQVSNITSTLSAQSNQFNVTKVLLDSSSQLSDEATEVLENVLSDLSSSQECAQAHLSCEASLASANSTIAQYTQDYAIIADSLRTTSTSLNDCLTDKSSLNNALLSTNAPLNDLRNATLADDHTSEASLNATVTDSAFNATLVDDHTSEATLNATVTDSAFNATLADDHTSEATLNATVTDSAFNATLADDHTSEATLNATVTDSAFNATLVDDHTSEATLYATVTDSAFNATLVDDHTSEASLNAMPTDAAFNATLADSSTDSSHPTFGTRTVVVPTLNARSVEIISDFLIPLFSKMPYDSHIDQPRKLYRVVHQEFLQNVVNELQDIVEHPTLNDWTQFITSHENDSTITTKELHLLRTAKFIVETQPNPTLDCAALDNVSTTLDAVLQIVGKNPYNPFSTDYVKTEVIVKMCPTLFSQKLQQNCKATKGCSLDFSADNLQAYNTNFAPYLYYQDTIEEEQYIITDNSATDAANSADAVL